MHPHKFSQVGASGWDIACRGLSYRDCGYGHCQFIWNLQLKCMHFERLKITLVVPLITWQL